MQNESTSSPPRSEQVWTSLQSAEPEHGSEAASTHTSLAPSIAVAQSPRAPNSEQSASLAQLGKQKPNTHASPNSVQSPGPKQGCAQKSLTLLAGPKPGPHASPPVQ